MYQATNISYRVGEKQLLDKVNLTLVPGKFTAVAGPNGAGKSTLLKTLAQEHRHYEGNVFVNGKSAKAYSPRELSLVRAVLSQNTTIAFAFTAQQIVALGRHGHRGSRSENERIVDEVIALTGLDAFRERSYLTLSGGEKQRVQLARVLVQVWEETLFPRYILLDEPTSSLDIAQQQLIFDLAKKACTRNIGVMAIVHDLNQAVQFADDLYFLRAGKIVASGEAHQVFTKPMIEETFCCRVNIYRDPCNNCPYIIPEREPFAEPRPVAVNL